MNTLSDIKQKMESGNTILVAIVNILKTSLK